MKAWKENTTGPSSAHAFVPLIFAPGEVCQFDWSHEHVELGGVLQTIRVAHFRLTHGRQMFLVAYPRETQEMVFAPPRSIRVVYTTGGTHIPFLSHE